MNEYLYFSHNSNDFKRLSAASDVDAQIAMTHLVGEDWREAYNLVRLTHL